MKTCIVRVILIGSLLTTETQLGLSQARSASVTIGENEIALGMSAERAIAVLRENFKVESGLESPVHRWFVESAQNQTVGSIYTKENVIVGVEHLIFSRNLDAAQDVFGALYEVSSRLSKRGETPAQLLHGPTTTQLA